MSPEFVAAIAMVIGSGAALAITLMRLPPSTPAPPPLGIDSLREALRRIRDMGPATVDDQRWRIAKDALEDRKPD